MKNKLFSAMLSVLLLHTATCYKGAYEAVESDTIQLSAAASSVVPGGTTTITISGIQKNSHPMPNDTLVRLGVENGTILNMVGETVEAVLLFNGKAQVIFRADNIITGGTATITASSGTAKIQPEKLEITIRNMDVASLLITADPTIIPPGQTTSLITVTALSGSGDPLSQKSIALETSAGALAPQSPIVTDSSGTVSATLTTTIEATVKATYKEIEKSITVAIGVNQPPQASFQFSPQAPEDGETVYFISTSSDPDGTIEQHHWNFGDGSPAETIPDPSHNFPTDTETREFKVVLTVTDNYGATATATQTVTIKHLPPEAIFTFSPQNPKNNETVYFNSQGSTGNIESYDWSFGDGFESGEANPTHAYTVTEEKTFTVTLKVTDDVGDTAVSSQPITVSFPIVAHFTYSPASPAAGDTISFDASSSSGTIILYQWDFGDNKKEEGTAPTITHSYANAGTYSVVLTVTDGQGNKNAYAQTITVQ